MGGESTALRIWSYSICKFTNVHPYQLAPFLGQLGAPFNFGGPGNVQDHQIWIFRKYEKSTYLASKEFLITDIEKSHSGSKAKKIKML